MTLVFLAFTTLQRDHSGELFNQDGEVKSEHTMSPLGGEIY